MFFYSTRASKKKSTESPDGKTSAISASSLGFRNSGLQDAVEELPIDLGKHQGSFRTGKAHDVSNRSKLMKLKVETTKNESKKLSNATQLHLELLCSNDNAWNFDSACWTYLSWDHPWLRHFRTPGIYYNMLIATELATSLSKCPGQFGNTMFQRTEMVCLQWHAAPSPPPRWTQTMARDVRSSIDCILQCKPWAFVAFRGKDREGRIPRDDSEFLLEIYVDHKKVCFKDETTLRGVGFLPN